MLFIDATNECIKVTNNNKLTLDMDGYLISTNKTFTNRGELTITNGNTEKEAVIKSSSAINIITNMLRHKIELCKGNIRNI